MLWASGSRGPWLGAAVKEAVHGRVYEGYNGAVWKLAVELEKKPSGSRGQKRSVWAVPGSFFAMQSISGWQYMKRDRDETKSGRVRAKKPSVQYRTSRTVSREHNKDYIILHMAALETSKTGEESFMDRAERFTF